MKENKRLLAVDILRGITIAGMLLVNNPGTWSHLYRPLAPPLPCPKIAEATGAASRAGLCRSPGGRPSAVAR